jgi:hypothetical protein
MIYPS